MPADLPSPRPDSLPEPPANLRSGLWERGFMTFSVFARMIVGLTVLVLLARAMGPARYGLFATIMSYGYLISLLTDFGLAIKTLRDIGADRAGAAARMASAVSLKLLLSGLASLIGLGIILILPIDTPAKVAAALIGAGVLVGSIGDLIAVGFRAVRRFDTEAVLVFWTSIIHALIVAPVAFLFPDPLWVGAAFVASRTLYAVAVLLTAQKTLGSSLLRRPRANEIWTELRGTGWWAADSGLSYVTSQIDGPIIAHSLGLVDAGLYQSGNRFVQAACAVGSVLSNVHIPRLAARAAGKPRFGDEWKIYAEFTGLGALAGGFFWLCGPLLSRWLLGPAYADVDKLWPGFAVFVFLRYLGAALGVSLSAHALPATRTAAQLAGLAVLAVGFVYALPRYGLVAAPWIMALGTGVIALVYAGTLLRVNLRGGAS